MAVRAASASPAPRLTGSFKPSSRRVSSHVHPPKVTVRWYSQKPTEVQGYEELIRVDDATKVRRIAESYFLPDALNLSNHTELSSPDLLALVNKVKQKTKLPIHSNPLRQSLDHDDALHYQENSTFINLPYAQKTQVWSDRIALQRMIRDHFKQLYQDGDLAIVPGCADGQIAIEIYGNSLKNGIKLHDIVAADYNLHAMELGCITMSSFGLNPNRIKWMQANVAHESFFRWINKQYPQIRCKHQVATLVQPSLREENLLAFLKNCSHLAQLSNVTSTIVMPVLLADQRSAWYKSCDSYVKLAFERALKTAEFPLCIWNKTKYGMEFMRRVQGKTTYAPQQYFVDPSSLSDILKETKLDDTSKKIFDSVENPNDYTHPEDPRRIPPAEGSPEPASRIFCIWEAKPVS